MPAGRGQTSLLSSVLATDNPGLCEAPTQLIIGAGGAQATRTCRELEKGTCDSHASFNASGEGENEGNTQSSWKVRRWPKTTISDGARPKISRNGAGWCRYISTGTGKKMKKEIGSYLFSILQSTAKKESQKTQLPSLGFQSRICLLPRTCLGGNPLEARHPLRFRTVGAVGRQRITKEDAKLTKATKRNAHSSL